jgi:WD40 repeat protein
MEDGESAEERALVISHNALSKPRSDFDWTVLSRADQPQHFSSDSHCNLFAIYSAPGIIDLWDLSTSPVALAFLNVPTRSAYVDQHEENECQSINWSRCTKYLLALFWTSKSGLHGGCDSVLHLWDVASGLVVTSLRSTNLLLALRRVFRISE